MKYVLDTHVWIWSILEPERLTSSETAALQNETSEFLLSSVTFWEAHLLHERGRIDLGADPKAWFDFALREYPITEIPLDRRIAIDSRNFDPGTADPADRFIAATARVHGAILLTQDQRLVESPAVPTLAF